LGLTAAVIAAVLGTAGPAAAQATTYYWNATGGEGGGSGTWDTTTANWNDQEFWTGNQVPWPNTATTNAVFNSPTTDTVTLGLSLTAGSVSVTNSNITFSNAGNFTLTASSFNVSSGASATIAGTNFFKTGTTALNVDGNLTVNDGPASGRLVTLTGGGTLTANGGIRIAGNNAAMVFSGNLVDFNTGAGQRLAINMNGSSTGTVLRLSGNNSGATGDFLISSGTGQNNNVMRFESANAISSSSVLRIEGGTNVMVELAAADLTRTTNNTAGSGGGGFNLTGQGGFAALGADRNVTLVGGGQIVWGTQGFNPAGVGFQFGDTNATNKLTLTNDIALGTSTRNFNVVNGAGMAANAIVGALPGVISGTGGLQINGTGRLVISGNNTFTGNVGIGVANTVPFVQITNSNALGTGGTISIFGNAALGGLELAGGITLARPITLSGRPTTNTNPGIINVSGNNTLTGLVTGTTGGSFYLFQSNAGILTIQNGITTNNSGTRGVSLGGAGDGVLNGTLTGPNTSTPVFQFTKYGTGTWTLGGSVALTGAANTAEVQGGTLLVNSSFTGVGASTTTAVRAGATLGGTGNVGGAVSLDGGGAIRGGAPGGTGTLTVPGNLTINSAVGSNGILSVEASRVSPGNANASLISVTTGGVLNLNPGPGNQFTINLVNGTSSLQSGEAYTLTLATVDTPGNIQLNGASLGASTTIDPSNYVLQSSAFAAFSGVSLAVDGTGTALVLTFTPVPESGWLLAVAGMSVLALRRRRQGNHALAV
jgi:autotransporter-associated beta strand protein